MVPYLNWYTPPTPPGRLPGPMWPPASVVPNPTTEAILQGLMGGTPPPQYGPPGPTMPVAGATPPGGGVNPSAAARAAGMGRTPLNERILRATGQGGGAVPPGVPPTPKGGFWGGAGKVGRGAMRVARSPFVSVPLGASMVYDWARGEPTGTDTGVYGALPSGAQSTLLDWMGPLFKQVQNLEKRIGSLNPDLSRPEGAQWMEPNYVQPGAAPASPAASTDIMSLLAAGLGGQGQTFSFPGGQLPAPIDTGAFQQKLDAAQQAMAAALEGATPKSPEFSPGDRIAAILQGIAAGVLPSIGSTETRGDALLRAGLGAVGGAAGHTQSRKKEEKEYQQRLEDYKKFRAIQEASMGLDITKSGLELSKIKSDEQARLLQLTTPQLKEDSALIPQVGPDGKLRYTIKPLPNQKMNQIMTLATMGAGAEAANPQSIIQELALSAPNELKKYVGGDVMGTSGMMKGAGLSDKTIDAAAANQILAKLKAENPGLYQAAMQQAMQKNFQRMMFKSLGMGQ